MAGNVWNFGVQLQISEPDVFSCKLHLFPCAADYSGFVAEWTWWGWSEKKKRVAAIYESKQPACLQSEHQNKLEFFFNIFNYPAKFSVSDLRNDSFAAGGAGRRTGVFFCLLSNSVCLSSFGLLVLLYLSRRPIWWLIVVWGFNGILLIKLYSSLTSCFAALHAGVFAECPSTVRWRPRTSIPSKWLQSSVWHPDLLMSSSLLCVQLWTLGFLLLEETSFYEQVALKVMFSWDRSILASLVIFLFICLQL